MKCIGAFALLMAMITAGCSKKNDDPGETVKPLETVLKRDEVMKNVRQNLYHIEEWYIVKGKDTTFLNSDQHYDSLMKHVYIQFYANPWDSTQTWLCYRHGTEAPNTEFLGKAKIFNVVRDSPLALGFDYGWDDAEGTLSILDDTFPPLIYGPTNVFPENVTAKLDKSGYRHVNSLDEAKTSHTTGFLKFGYQHEGKNYTVLLKQMWGYNTTADFDRFVVF
ncbi:hypothetical protein [Dyadobacter jiangsuensis]|uniref:Uncharacterized protein n=1 Tax=Dyadobacter jiangsuensis TaxID=1591085 RepID=A0A2P8FNB5_9BACT|nr:hypothetical protein [Dyadobacter jiangsuensis]PSL23216.1 hypothetical protein CLV60_11793 [Dyadobacter jiangsuensis]